MALDNANFIAELSITDPPGTDPISQGDDQIRTVKRATQQSFPFIDKQVDLTADQMNEAAIKNEANVFTAKQTITENNIALDAVTDKGASYEFRRADVIRWQTTMGLDVNNNDWSLTRFDLIGAFQDNPMTCDNLTGVVDFSAVPTIKGDPIWTAGEVKMLVQGASLPSNNWFSMNGTNGTVDIRDRILAAQGTFTGNTAPFLQAKTDDNLLTDSTAISEAQMPAHDHSIFGSAAGMEFPLLAAGGGGMAIAGIENISLTGAFAKTAGDGQDLMANTGGGGGHTHTIPELNVETDGSDAFQVMPFSYMMQVIQYVP